jgi:hypothetical protein
MIYANYFELGFWNDHQVLVKSHRNNFEGKESDVEIKSLISVHFFLQLGISCRFGFSAILIKNPKASRAKFATIERRGDGNTIVLNCTSERQCHSGL